MYRFQTMGEYNALLGLYNIDVKHVKGEKFGKEYNGIVYSVKNEKGEITGAPFKSSLFGKSFGFEGLTKTMKNNADILKTKDVITHPKAVVSAAMRTAGTKEEFVKALQEKGMDVVFRANNDGRIYGVTFIDHENRVALNGSRLGKDYSANVFHVWLNEGKKPSLISQHPQQSQQLQQSQSSQSRFPERQIIPAQTPVNQHGNTLPEPAKSYDTSMVEEIFGMFGFKPHGEDYEEIAFARRMRKKKKRKI